MSLVVRAYPLPRGRQALEAFAEELRGERAQQTRDFYERYGARETWHVQETEHGTWVIGVTQLDGRTMVDVGAEYAATTAEFDSWFKQRVLEVTGIDPNSEPLGPPTQLVFDSAEL
jgi:hypothetical protein